MDQDWLNGKNPREARPGNNPSRASYFSTSKSLGTGAGLSHWQVPLGPKPLVLWDGGVAVTMEDPDMALALEVGIEDITIAVVPPPGAQLPIPGAVQNIEEVWVLHAHHSEEVLVSQVTLEVVFLSELLQRCWLQQLMVERRLTHGIQV